VENDRIGAARIRIGAATDPIEVVVVAMDRTEATRDRAGAARVPIEAANDRIGVGRALIVVATDPTEVGKHHTEVRDLSKMDKNHI
jgi:hypothetical protein